MRKNKNIDLRLYEDDDGGETSFFQEEEVVDYDTPIWD